MSNYKTIRIDPPYHLIWNEIRYRCALGWAGLSSNKCEGDGTTPIGRFPLRRVFYRPDRITKPKTQLAVHALRPQDVWCDDPSNEAYNQLVSLPFLASREHLWRKDHVYDLILELGYNDSPTIVGKGSAIFMHLAKPAYLPTQGCIALRCQDLLKVLENCESETEVVIPAPS